MGKLIKRATQSLSPLSEYLQNPHSRGVHYAKLSIGRESLQEFRTRFGLKQHLPSTGLVRPGSTPFIRPGLRELLMQVKAELLDKESPRGASITTLKPVLDWAEFVRGRGVPARFSTGYSQPFILRRSLRLMPTSVMGPHIPLDRIGDALHISELVQGESSQTVTISLHFSSRVVYDLVPAASSSWTQETATIERVPQFILSYIEAAVDYIREEEWRTSVVLSAIALESLLAEMYENEFREQAPGEPLGSLVYKIEERFKKAKKGRPFPEVISESIKACNNARISAVHRGGHEPSSKEAQGALSGAVKFSIWYLFGQSGGKANPAIVPV
jgi:hypothetical protein